MSLPGDHDERMRRAGTSLQGLSVGDAFGETFFRHPTTIPWRLANRYLPEKPWYFTDDTMMALSIVDVIAAHGRIDPDGLAQHFARRYELDPGRGYGAGAIGLLREIAGGGDWRSLAPAMFGGEGSLGNGAAMRVAPLGAYFAGDLERAAAEAVLSAEVTHAHPDGIAGAVAIAVAAAFIAHQAQSSRDFDEHLYFDAVLARTPESATREGILTVRDIPLEADVEEVVLTVGNGDHVTSADTVPFCLWCVARHWNDYEEALWATVSGLGDRDTTCAIVGGIIASQADVEIPSAWLDAREPV